ncbi:MAG: methionyl-tRNA formyltransferase [Gammaproteobacteria bacterium]|nr:methionyl-tRNA formyltransferase [Gammaproteobacteria bacterium]
MARIVFAGSPDFAVPSLEQAIASGHDVVAVLTQPDRPSGRGRKLQPGPVKICAERHDIEVYQPLSLRAPEAQNQLRAFAPDLMIVVAYGQLLPAAVLNLPASGCVNVHASLLPRWRGASPIQTSILSGDHETGVSIMQMEEGLDTGPVYAMAHTPIGANETSAELHDRLSVMGAELLGATLNQILDGSLVANAQDDSQSTYAPRLNKSDAVIDWSMPAIEIDQRIRAFNPWPVAETVFAGERLRCWRSCIPSETVVHSYQQPGTVIGTSPDGLDVLTGEGVLRITELQVPGRQKISAADFAHAAAIDGKVLGL